MYLYNKKSVKNHSYFKKQNIKPYISTIEFFKFLQKNISINKNIIDIGCGNGSQLIYLRNILKNKKKLMGIDINKDLILDAKKKSTTFKNINFIKKDFKSISNKNFNEYEGVISLQTLSFIQDYKDVIKFLKNSHFKFFACSSLFWEGLIDFKIKVNELFDNSPSRKIKNFTYYNIYSLNNYINTMKSIGFKKNIVKKFIIKKPLQNKNKKKMGTYTLKNNKELIQISGPILMSWYFILSKKN